MRLGIGYYGDKPLAELLEMASMAEELGIESAWVADQYLLRECTVAMALLASKTKAMRIGVATVNPYTRHVAVHAMATATLVEQFGDRFMLGVGAGIRPQRQLLGRELDGNMARVREFIEVLRRLLAGEEVSYRGKGIWVDGIRLGFPCPKRVPIYLGAIGRGMVELAGELCDGLFITGGASASYVRQALNWLKRGAERACKDASSIDIASYAMLALADEPSKGKAMAKRWIATFLVQPFFTELSKVSGVEEADIESLRERARREGIEEAWRHVKDYIVELLAPAGSLRDCIGWLEDYSQAGVKQTVLIPMGPNPTKSIRAVAEALKGQ